MSTSITIYIVNALLVLAAFGLVLHHDITWIQAAALVAVLLTPSGLHVALQGDK